jgi:hypothetical protein
MYVYRGVYYEISCILYLEMRCVLAFCPLAELPLGALPRVLLAEISEMS